MKNLVILTALIFSVLSSTFAATFTSIKDGNWDDPKVWDLGKVPNTTRWPGDIVIIKHEVKYNKSLNLNQGSGFHIENGGVLFVDGSLKTGGKGESTIKQGGILVAKGLQHNAWSGSFMVVGTLDLQNGEAKINGVAKLILNGELKARSLSIGGSGKLKGEGGTMIIKENFTVNGGSEISMTDMIIQVDGNFTRNGGPNITFTNSDVYVDGIFKGSGGGKMDLESTFLIIKEKLAMTGSFTIFVSGRGELEATIITLSGAASIQGINDGGWLKCKSIVLSAGAFIECADRERKYSSYNIDGMDNPLDLGILRNASLPIELTYFTSTTTADGILHQWETAAEINNDFFTVEYSFDGTNWETVGTVQGAGNANEAIQYQLISSNYPATIIYFRLKQTDFDGTATYSTVNVIKNQKSYFDVAVYPNPVIESMTISGLNTDDVADVVLTNQQGQMMAIPFENNGYAITATVNGQLPAGQYSLIIKSANQQLVKQIIVQR